MPPLSDIEAHCERDKSRMDSQHEQIDRLSSDGSSSSSGSNPAAPSPPQYVPQPKRAASAVALLTVAAVMVIVIVLILLFVVLPQGNSPTKAYREYVDASNDRDIKRMFDQTVTRFTPDYEDRLDNLSSIVFLLNPQIDIQSLSVTYQSNMSGLEKITAEVIVSDVEDKLSVDVGDYCYVDYTISIYYADIDQTATFPGQVLCVSINGHWYLAVPGFY